MSNQQATPDKMRRRMTWYSAPSMSMRTCSCAAPGRMFCMNQRVMLTVVTLTASRPGVRDKFLFPV
eukprot:CAMPEP_0202922914 /NCGR_PEP_ID=MMETSP1392-20130828/78176_1 /ASSEMBLY_ACC=CAM_ASM_000868 /TAXON_ID=225041 /ORGANISM="Chlamydomonas chlamydogama, Strain SAG 11-48b" /LENGTH=65 /DNA_ID=CAMNT_0049616569 /DNA_START=468 /DNA_END=665 /DNA_ORIENTATION=+